MSAYNVCRVRGVIIVGLYFADSLAVSDPAAMELTAFLVIRVPACVEFLCAQFAIFWCFFHSFIHCRTEATGNVLCVLGIEPAILAVTAPLDELFMVALHDVVVGMDSSFVYSDDSIIGMDTEFLTSE